MAKAKLNGTNKATKESDDKLIDFAVEQIITNRQMAANYRNVAGMPGVDSEAAARDYWGIFGYDANLTYDDYRLAYERGPGGRIIDKRVGVTWQKPPQITEGGKDDTAFVMDVGQLARDFDLWDTFLNADRQSSIGQFSVILLGLKDAPVDDDGNQTLPSQLNQPVENPVNGIDDLLYMRVYSQADVTNIKIDSNPQSKRFGLPETYTITPKQTEAKADTAITYSQSPTLVVHWSRIIHVADKAIDNDFLGTPMLRRSMNVLRDIEKTGGGSAEAYWRVAYTGMSVNVDSDAVVTEADKEAIKEQVQEYINGYRRTLVGQNIKPQQMEGRDVDPSGMWAMLKEMLGATGELSNRIVFGSERGNLASSQDAQELAAQTVTRQISFANDLIRDMLNRLVKFGVLSPYNEATGFDIGTQDETGAWVWPSILQSTPLEQAQITNLDAQTDNLQLQGYVTARTEGLTVDMAARISGYTEDESEAIADDVLHGMVGAEDVGIDSDFAGLNGAQITAVLEVLDRVSAGAVDDVAAIELISSVGMPRERAATIVQRQKAKPTVKEVE